MFKLSIKLITAFTLTMLFLYGCSNTVEPEEHHFEAVGLYVISGADTIVKYVDGQVSGNIEVKQGTQTPLLSTRFINEDGDVGIPEGDEYSFTWDLENSTYAEVSGNEDELNEYKFYIDGKQTGSTTITIILNHNDHKDFESEEIPVIVTP